VIPSNLMTALRALACASSLGALAATSAGCAVGVDDADYPPGAYDDYPPDAYIATAEPVYFEGHATYFYGNRWYYRDGSRWNHYDREPAGLAQRRSAAPMVRRSYEPGRVHAAARPSARGGGGRGHH
jgi:hypothetical protein